MTEKAIKILLGRRRKSPFVFREFFEMGLEESASPFLNYKARKISQNLSLKSSCFSALLLLISFVLSKNPAFTPISSILLIAVYLIAGTGSLIDSAEDLIIRRDVNIDVLMTLAAFSAFFLGAGFEGALLLVLFSISGSLESAVTLKAKRALTNLHNIAPTKAYVLLDDGRTTERAVQDIEVGTIILVRSGEIVPLDGIVVDGASSVSLAHLTGESRPIKKGLHQEVPSGALVLEGSLTLKISTTTAESTVAKIVELITKAQEMKPKLERWFDKFSKTYAISIILATILFAISFPFFLDISYFGKEGSIYRALAFLITASPCALIIAVPIAYLSSLGVCAKRGIVMKGASVLDALSRCQVVAFDKTGTLTLGDLTLNSIQGDFTKYSEQMVLAIGASLERNAVHPIAKAIVKESEKRDIKFIPAVGIKVIPGQGVEGRVIIDDKELTVFIGDVEKAVKSSNNSPVIHDFITKSKKSGYIVAAISIENDLFLLSFEDRIRPNVSTMLKNLKEHGKRVLMLTGDHKESAAHIANLASITEYYSDLSPEDKLNKISELSKNYGLAMVGDGINDAPALARATVGICLGEVGSGTAKEAADVIFLHDNIELLDWLFQKSHSTKKIVFQNLTVAMSAIIFASAFALYGTVPLWLAVILHEGGTLLVGLNAIRLLKD